MAGGFLNESIKPSFFCEKMYQLYNDFNGNDGRNEAGATLN